MGGTTLNQYQFYANRTAVYPGQATQAGLEYTLFGFLGEGGELANKYKKILRSQLSPYGQREVLMDELGDALWYAALLAKELGYTLEEVAEFNLNKLAERQAAGQLKEHK
jgi:NTP pyrophosphatase (non-canonical NTP hydrolase)